MAPRTTCIQGPECGESVETMGCPPPPPLPTIRASLCWVTGSAGKAMGAGSRRGRAEVGMVLPICRSVGIGCGEAATVPDP